MAAKKTETSPAPKPLSGAGSTKKKLSVSAAEVSSRGKSAPQVGRSKAVSSANDAAVGPDVSALPPALLGKKAPAFRLQDQSGAVVTSASLAGKSYVLYFYPKDNTPGCTTETCDFRDHFGNFRTAGVTVFGVSPDAVKSHAGFSEKLGLPFSLLSDPERKLAEAYGVWAKKRNYGREYWGIVRSTFLVGASGKVEKEWRAVKVSGHASAVLQVSQQ